jgi:formylglycine-generating enzyme required for sulfatase activity
MVIMVIRFLLVLGVFLGCACTQAQTVSAVTAAQQGNELVISYSLSSEVPCEVALFVSLNGGKTWTGPLVHVSGDVGEKVTSGNKSIRWKVLEEQDQLVGSNIFFKVTASGKNLLEPEMVFVKGGTFQMGSNSGELDERPVHWVELSDYRISKHEVTQAQWKAVMGENPSMFDGCDNCPVEQVSWNDVQGFISKLNYKTGERYRLPTEAEWEYAAKGGKNSKRFFASGSDNLADVAWYVDNSEGKTHVVGTKQPNELGIYDMTGNVSEWCLDWYAAYRTYVPSNPAGGPSGQFRTLRGGSWTLGAYDCRTAARFKFYPDFRSKILGFRLVLAADS